MYVNISLISIVHKLDFNSLVRTLISPYSVQQEILNSICSFRVFKSQKLECCALTTWSVPRSRDQFKPGWENGIELIWCKWNVIGCRLGAQFDLSKAIWKICQVQLTSEQYTGKKREKKKEDSIARIRDQIL